MEQFDCLIIGAGAAGIGMGCVLKDLGVKRFGILERSEVGASFLMWPKEMRMITPSFTGNAYGMLDLNAVALKTSPAYTLETEHPSGEDYADYLQAVADFRELPIRTGIDVTAVSPVEDGFVLETTQGQLFSRYVIWAAGEFQYPRLDGFEGAEHCYHSSLISEWSGLEGEEFVIIGGYESGADALIHLGRLGRKVTLIDRNDRFSERGSSDPSVELSPYTKDRLNELQNGDQVELLSGHSVHWVAESEDGGFLICCEDAAGTERFVKTAHPPILATGFKSSLGLVKSLFEMDGKGHALLNQYDESTQTPGLFLSGPGVVHGELLFCFIYKFRQRFAVVAGAIAEGLGLSKAPLEEYRRAGLLLEDLSCCGEDCQC